MNKMLWIVAGSLSLLCAAVSADEPFAKRAQVPSELKDAYLATSAREAVIPDKQRVGIPSYPGAVVIRTYAVDVRPPVYEGLPIVEMISSDDYQAVVDYYKKELPQWGQGEMLSAYYFAQNGNINFFKPEEPHVGVHKLENYYREDDKQVLRKILPGAQTLIKVWFAK